METINQRIAGELGARPEQVAAARGLAKHSKLSATEIVRESLQIAADIDVYTNNNIIVEELQCAK